MKDPQSVVTVEEESPIKLRKNKLQKSTLRPKSVRSDASFGPGSAAFRKKQLADEGSIISPSPTEVDDEPMDIPQ